MTQTLIISVFVNMRTIGNAVKQIYITLLYLLCKIQNSCKYKKYNSVRYVCFTAVYIVFKFTNALMYNKNINIYLY